MTGGRPLIPAPRQLGRHIGRWAFRGLLYYHYCAERIVSVATRDMPKAQQQWAKKQVATLASSAAEIALSIREGNGRK
jgi:hypothetical protein